MDRAREAAAWSNYPRVAPPSMYSEGPPIWGSSRRAPRRSIVRRWEGLADKTDVEPKPFVGGFPRHG